MRAPFVFLTVMYAVTAHGAETISGRIVSTSSSPLSNTIVSIPQQTGVVDTTGTDGRFSLTIATTPVSPRLQATGNPSFSMTSNRIAFTLTRRQQVTLRLHGLDGKLIGTVHDGALEKGRHAFTFDPIRFSISTGAYILALAGGDLAARVNLAVVNGRVIANASIGQNPEGHGAAVSAAAQNTLVISKKGYNLKKVSLSSLSTQNLSDIQLGVRSYVKSTVSFTSSTFSNQNHPLVLLLPSDYEFLDSLPVFYLLHGGGQDETQWISYGGAQTTFSNDYAKDSVVPMIVVMPHGAPDGGDQMAIGPTADKFLQELRTDIIPYIEKTYKASPDRFKRANSGLSAGGIQTLNLTLFYPKLWGYSFPMSTGYFEADITTLKNTYQASIIVADVNSLKLFQLGNNPPDMSYDNNKNTMAYFDQLGIMYKYHESPSGGHTWEYWTAYLKVIVPLLFR